VVRIDKMNKLISDKIDRYTKITGKSVEFLLEHFNELIEVEKKKHPRMGQEGLEKKALVELRGFLRRDLKTLVRSGAVAFRGFIFGDSGVMDIIEFMKMKGEGMYARGGKDRAFALKNRFVNSEGIALDTREMIWEEGKQVPNPRYGYPFPEDEHAYQRILHGVVGMGEEMKDARLFQLRSRDKYALNLEYPIWKFISFRATVRDDKRDDIYLLNMTSVTEFKELDNEVNFEKLLRNCKQKIWEIHEVGKAWAFYKGDEKLMRNNPLLFEGEVQRIDPEPDRFNRRSFWLDDEQLFDSQDYGVRFQFPFPIPIENSQKIIAIGYPNKYKNRQDEEVISINGYGYYPLPEYLR